MRYASANAAIRRASVKPPQCVRSNWQSRSLGRQQIAKRRQVCHAFARGDRRGDAVRLMAAKPVEMLSGQQGSSRK